MGVKDLKPNHILSSKGFTLISMLLNMLYQKYFCENTDNRSIHSSSGFVLVKVILAIVLSIVALGTMKGLRKKNIEQNIPPANTQVGPTWSPISTTFPTQTYFLREEPKTPRPSPSPLPTAPSLTAPYKIVISESELNAYLTKVIVESGDNPLTTVKITL